VGATLQLEPSVFVIVTHLTFDDIVTWGASTVTAVPGSECFGDTESVGSQDAEVEVQVVRPNGVHLDGHGVETTVVGKVDGHPQGMVCVSSCITCGCAQLGIALQSWGRDMLVTVGQEGDAGLWSAEILVTSL
jgi:hypothetical protein